MSSKRKTLTMSHKSNTIHLRSQHDCVTLLLMRCTQGTRRQDRRSSIASTSGVFSRDLRLLIKEGYSLQVPKWTAPARFAMCALSCRRSLHTFTGSSQFSLSISDKNRTAPPKEHESSPKTARLRAEDRTGDASLFTKFRIIPKCFLEGINNCSRNIRRHQVKETSLDHRKDLTTNLTSIDEILRFSQTNNSADVAIPVVGMRQLPLHRAPLSRVLPASTYSVVSLDSLALHRFQLRHPPRPVT